MFPTCFKGTDWNPAGWGSGGHAGRRTSYRHRAAFPIKNPIPVRKRPLVFGIWDTGGSRPEGHTTVSHGGALGKADGNLYRAHALDGARDDVLEAYAEHLHAL